MFGDEYGGKINAMLEDAPDGAVVLRYMVEETSNPGYIDDDLKLFMPVELVKVQVPEDFENEEKDA